MGAKDSSERLVLIYKPKGRYIQVGCNPHGHRSFRENTYNHFQSSNLKKEVSDLSETLVMIYQAKRHYIPEESNLRQKCPASVTTVPWIKWLVVEFPTRLAGFEPRSYNVGFVGNKVALEPSTSISPTNFHFTDSSIFINHPVIRRYIISILTTSLNKELRTHSNLVSEARGSVGSEFDSRWSHWIFQ
jgi:hypothetical protein